MMLKGLCAAAALLTLGTGMLAAQELRIAKALYGHDSRWMDVTEQLRRAERGERLDVVVSNQFFGSDPAPANAKTLRIEYYVNGQFMREEIPENARLVLPHGERREGPGRRLRILSAHWGLGGRDPGPDLTGVLQSMVRDGRLFVRVSPEALGGDPFPGRPKMLRVEYEYEGRTYRTEVRDFGELRLPEPNAREGGAPMPPPPPAEEMRGGLRIIYAGYGARDRFTDVTRILRNLRSPDGSLHIKVNNTNMGGDPFIGADKILRIDFEIQGRKMHRELREGDFLNLP